MIWLRLLLVCTGVKYGSPLCDLCRALCHVSSLVLRRNSCVAPWSSYERLADGEGGLRGELVPGVAVLREVGPFGEIRREVEPQEVALEGPAVGHLLAAGDSRGSHPRQQKPFGKATLGHACYVAGPKKRSARDIVW